MTTGWNRHRRIAALVVLVILAAAGVTIAARDTGDDRGAVARRPDGVPSPVDGAPSGADEWRDLPTGPFEQGAISAVWTGNEMIVAFDGGWRPHAMRFAAYDPATDQWQELPAPPTGLQAPFGLTPVAVWTGDELLVWGYADGRGNESFDGEMQAIAYDPSLRSWRSLPDPPVQGLIRAEPVWTGTELLVWGGDGSAAEVLAQGARYSPTTDQWQALPPGPLTGRENPTTIWTGREMIVWGGLSLDAAEGAAYDPEVDRWRVLARSPIGSPRAGASAAWTGREMVIWGGYGGSDPAIGAAYDPVADLWRMLPDAPLDAREGPGSAWTGRELIIWGGISFSGGRQTRADGAAYDPATDRWRRLPPAPLVSRFAPAAVWTGGEIIFFGGSGPSAPGQPDEPARRDGAAYRPVVP